MPKSVAVLAAVVILGETAPASSVLPGIPSHRPSVEAPGDFQGQVSRPRRSRSGPVADEVKAIDHSSRCSPAATAPSRINTVIFSSLRLPGVLELYAGDRADSTAEIEEAQSPVVLNDPKRHQ